MEYLVEYGLFLAKTVTVVAVPLFGLFILLMLTGERHRRDEEHLEITHLNQALESTGLILKQSMLPAGDFKKALKDAKKSRKMQRKGKATTIKKNVFVLDFKGDIKASALTSLRKEITAILLVATPEDEVILRLESPGGMVHSYGLAASQLSRIKSHDIPLTVAIDQIAASGGYLMACVADHIVAAPFAVIGSIGVVGQLPNFSKLLKKHDIDFEQHTAGEYKRSLTVFGENTDKDRQKFQQDLEQVHELFKDFVQQHRAKVAIKEIATGEHWYAKRALELNLVDELDTSDDYLLRAAENANIYKIKYERRKSLPERLFSYTAQLSRLPLVGWAKTLGQHWAKHRHNL